MDEKRATPRSCNFSGAKWSDYHDRIITRDRAGLYLGLLFGSTFGACLLHWAVIA